MGFFDDFFFSNEKLLSFWIFIEFNIWAKVYHIGKIEVLTEVNYCWNYRPPTLLPHLIEYRLDELNNKDTKMPVNRAIKHFASCFQKNCLVKVWSFLVNLPQNYKPVKFLGNSTETIFWWPIYFQTSKYQIFGLMKMHNMSKIWFANSKFSLWKSLVYD